MDEVAEIKQKLDIADVIGGYIQLKPAGRNLKALSPFHAEKTPSFMVSPDKGIWHDFSTDEGGDIFTFVMRMEGVSFPEALEILAKRAGVTLKPRGKGERGPAKAPLYDIAELAVRYYHLSLSRNPQALDYLRTERGLSPKAIKAFQLGYAPQSWDALTGMLKKKGYSYEQMVQAGVAAQKQGKSSAYDMFRARIVFPIFDSQGRPVGFSGRVLPGDEGGAKYINTPQTAIYNKSTAIYGLLQAKEAIRQHDEVVIVEGNMDVVALYDGGFEQVVACSGTALTSEQLKVLSRLTKNIKICFDQDVAGVKAAQRAIELAQGIDIKLEVITFDDAKDPDELMRKDKKLWEKAVSDARYAVDYLFDYAKETIGVSSASAKKQMSSFLSATLRKLEDTVEQDHYVKRLSEELGVSEDSVRRKLDQDEDVASAPQQSVPAPQPQPEAPQLSKQERGEQNLLKLMLAHPEARVAVHDIELSEVTEQFRPYFEVIQKQPKAKLETLAKLLPQHENDVKILALKGEEEYSELTEHDIGLEAYTQVHRLQKLNRELNKRRLAKQIAEAEAAGDREGAKRILADYQALLNEE
jgi:DNA primase